MIAIRLLLTLLVLLAGVGPASAQFLPKAWPDDANGIPAPPCTVFDPTTGITSFCTATNPIPTTGGGAGQGTSPSTSTSGFGKNWYSANFLPSGTMPIVASDMGTTFVGFTRTVACGNCLTINTSTDGGNNYIAANTSFIVGNDVQVVIKVPGTVPRYLGYTANGGSSQIFNSSALLSGWTAGTYGGTQLVNSTFSFASKPDGSVVLSTAGTAGATEVCKSTNQGQSFGACVTVGASNPSSNAISYAGGTTWVLITGTGVVFQSTNDGASWTNITTLAAGAAGGDSVLCLSAGFTNCVANANGNVFLSTNSGSTWVQIFNTGSNTPTFCDYGGGNVGVLGGTPPAGVGTITQAAWSSPNNGATFFPGNINGSQWGGAGTPTLAGLACNSSGRGAAAYHSTAGTANFTVYNPLSQPGGVLFSTAGGYNVVAPIQAGIRFDSSQTSAATTAQAITATGTAGSRVCLRTIIVFSSAATTFTLNVQDSTGPTIILNFGTITTGAAGTPQIFTGTPLTCSETGDGLIVNVGAAAAGTTTLSVTADRYPN